jgi:hypothetical protein
MAVYCILIDTFVMKIKARLIKLCKCGILRRDCKTHNPSRFCPCGLVIANCDKCKEHIGRCGCGRARASCPKHGGWSGCVCGSGHHKSRCTKCGRGAKLCEHGKRKTGCLICARISHETGVPSEYSSVTSEICIHSKARKFCLLCPGGGSHVCPQCRLTTTSTRNTLCSVCRRFNTGDMPIKQKEASFKKYLHACIAREELPRYTSHDKTVSPGLEKLLFGSNRPDFLFKLQDRWIILEVDESQHASKTYSCERRRELELCNCAGSLPVYFIRFNPDVFSTGDKTTRKRVAQETIERRHAKVVDEVKKAVSAKAPHGLTFVKLFYNCECMAEKSHYECGFVHVSHYTDHEDFLMKHQIM